MFWKNWFSDLGYDRPLPSTPKPTVIVLERERLDYPEIRAALEGNAGALWYKAIVSKIEQLRESNLLEASRAASAGNAMAMAGGLNTYEALSGLLYELADMVAVKKDET